MAIFVSIVFAQGDEGREITDGLYADGIATEESILATFRHLLQWETGDEEVIDDEPQHGASDEVFELPGGYVLTANRGLGYVGLERHII